MGDYKTYEAKSNFVLTPGRIVYTGEILRVPGDLDEKQANELRSMGRIESKTYEAPMKKTMTTKTGGSGLVGGTSYFGGGSSKSDSSKSDSAKGESTKP